MATFVNKFTGGAGTAGPYTTASLVPTGNRLYLLAVHGRTVTSTQPTTPAVTGAGLTWVEIGHADYDTTGTTDRQSIFLFRALAASPTTGALTITFGEALAKCNWVLDEVDGVDASGTAGSGAIVQSATNIGTGTSLTVTLAGFGDAINNAAYGVFAHQAAESKAPGSGFVELGDEFTAAGTFIATQTEYVIGEALTVDASWATSARAGGVAVEVANGSLATGARIVSGSDSGRLGTTSAGRYATSDVRGRL